MARLGPHFTAQNRHRAMLALELRASDPGHGETHRSELAIELIGIDFAVPPTLQGIAGWPEGPHPDVVVVLGKDDASRTTRITSTR